MGKEAKMKQIEVTVKVNSSLDEVDNILKKQGFKIIRTSRVEDKYMSNKFEQLTKDNILDFLKSCILIRFLDVNSKETFKRITYKDKVYKDKTVISEEKINIIIDNIEQAEKLFEKLGFKKIVEVNYDVIVYEKDGVELAFQNVENLGLLLEYESGNDYIGFSDEEIIHEKEKMLEEIRKLKINIENDYDVKKAYELIYKRL